MTFVRTRNQAQNENAIIAGRLAGAMNKVELTREVEQLKAKLDGEDDGNDSDKNERFARGAREQLSTRVVQHVDNEVKICNDLDSNDLARYRWQSTPS